MAVANNMEKNIETPGTCATRQEKEVVENARYDPNIFELN